MDRKQAGLLTGAALSTIGVWSAVLVTAWSGGGTADQVSDSVHPADENNAGYAETVEDEQTDRSILEDAYDSDEEFHESNEEDNNMQQSSNESSEDNMERDHETGEETSANTTTENERVEEEEEEEDVDEGQTREVREGDSIGYGDGVSVEEVLESLNGNEE